MRFDYQVVFIPKDVEIEDISETKEISMSSSARFDSRDELSKQARQEAIYQRSIDGYAVRNHWEIACCEMILKQSPWNNTKQLSEFMKSEYDVESIPQVRDNWRHESIECRFDSVDKRRTIQNKFSNRYNGKVPIASKHTNMRITLRAKANVGMDNFQEAKRVFKKHMKLSSS